VPSKAVRMAAVLILAASQIGIGERALARVSGGAMSGGSHSVGTGHFDARGHFARGRFGHRLRKNPVFLGGWGWGWDWPYADYGDTSGAAYGNTTIVAYPPPLSAAHASDNCRWNAESFTVPASAGGTRPVQVVSCR
jgi:hypothetical protein